MAARLTASRTTSRWCGGIYELQRPGEIDEALTYFADDIEWIEPAGEPRRQREGRARPG